MQAFMKSKWAIPEVIPLAIPVFSGVGFGVYLSVTNLTAHNDVIVDKYNPCQHHTTTGRKRLFSYDKTREWYADHGVVIQDNEMVHHKHDTNKNYL